MMTDEQHLLVPIKVQALVIDDFVIDKMAILKVGEQRRVANDGKWSPLTRNYQLLTSGLGSPGPKPFYEASRTAWGEPAAAQLLLAENSPALPEEKDRGVYLHWVLPSGLRHAYKPGSLDFPALPDQWLIVRFCRRGTTQSRAWFVDSGLIVDSDSPANLLIASDGQYTAKRVGKVTPLDQFTPADFEGERTTITALGNPQTGSPTFTASVAENRNVLSWHDDLADLRGSDHKGKIPSEAALSYLVLGWYHDKQNEPFVALPAQLTDRNVMEALGWRIDADTPPADLLNRRCLFHGMVAHINYWSANTYKGPLLGYPGSPPVEGVLDTPPPSFKVGLGNNAEDALVSLVSSEYSGQAEAPNLWKALEAVMYRQPESLVGSWNAAPRDHAVHQSWFSTVEAGKVWSIRPRPDKESAFPTDPNVTAAPNAVKPTSAQLVALKQLNERQAAADAIGRELAALQQDLYARWWKLCEQSRDQFASLKAYEDACAALARRVITLRDQLADSLKQLRTLPEELQKLPKELELRFDAAPRFWTPADPVIVVKNCGLPTKHQFPQPLPCRLPEQIINAAEVQVAGERQSFSATHDLREIKTAVQSRFAARGEVLARLLAEASLVEQAISHLAAATLPPEKKFFTAVEWRSWVKRLIEDLTWDGDSNALPRDQISFSKGGDLNVLPHRLAELWGQQPWSPLFLDWQIKWMPTPYSDQDFAPAWRLGEQDYQPTDRASLPEDGFTVRGRSLLSPIDGRIFNEPIATLRDLLKGGGKTKDDNPTFPAAVAEILSLYETVWDKTLAELTNAGMMGQALSGFHQTLLHRDVTLPQVTPDPALPWATDPDITFRDEEVRPLLSMPDEAALTGERLAPPAPADSALPFTLLRAGAFQLDELWLVDDFGQWADLLYGTSAGGSAGQVFHPRVRWHDDRFVFAMPPRIVQPSRLNFRFTAADDRLAGRDADSALSPICGWIFYNPLDQTLVLCHRDGRLAGELVITQEQGKFSVHWEAGTTGVALTAIRNQSLKDFAEALIAATPTATPRLLDLLKLVDGALERIRPAAARRDAALFGRPLALVSTALGLELFGKAWTDPQKAPAAARPSGTGDAALDALHVRVRLGCSHNTEDGLIGYFKAGDYRRIVPAHLPQGVKSSPAGYIGDPQTDAARVSFGPPQSLTLLMDPWGSVQAAAAIVPTKTITLAQPELDETLARMEASFRVGPVLLQPDRLALPTPASDKGRWNFSGPLTNHTAALVAPADARYFSDQPVVATEGRLLLLTPDE
jgi:hypothetical protein